MRHEATFRTEWPELVRSRQWALKILGKKANRSSVRYCIESTGCYHLPVLRAWCGEPSVVNPLLAGQTRRKTDVLDAQLLAHHSITGVWKKSFVPSSECQQLRVLWAQRNEATRAATRYSNRINNIILRFGHTIGAQFPMRSAEAEGVIDDMVHGRIPDSTGVAPSGLPKAMQPVIKGLYAQMKMLCADAKQAQTAAKIFVEKNTWPKTEGSVSGGQLLQLLTSVPGVGLTTAISWLCEIGDPKRFQHSKQVAAFCGCDPSVKVSAGKVTSHVRRAGNARLHNALGYAAQAVMQRPQLPLAQWARSIAGRHKKGGYRKATGAVTRRLACALWHVHRLGAAYDESKYNYNSMPSVPDVTLGDVVGKRYHDLLAENKITDARELAAAFSRGELARIRGFGEKAIEQVKSWIATHQQHERTRKVFTMNAAKKFTKREKKCSSNAPARSK